MPDAQQHMSDQAQGEPQNTEIPNADLYNATEQESIANQLSSRYKKAIEQEHDVDLVTSRTQDVFREASVLAAQQIVQLAVHCPNHSTRFKAASYIVDRVLGPSGKAESVGDKFAELLMHITTQAPAGQ